MQQPFFTSYAYVKVVKKEQKIENQIHMQLIPSSYVETKTNNRVIVVPGDCYCCPLSSCKKDEILP